MFDPESTTRASSPRWIDLQTVRPRQPPGWWFHLSLVPPTLLLLYSMSVPGGILFAFAAAALSIGAAAIVWFVIAQRYAQSPNRTGSRAWFLVAPAGAVIVAVVIAAGVPLQMRWAGSQSDFEEFVAELPPHGPVDRWRGVQAPDEIGSFRIWQVDRVGPAVLFYEGAGASFGLSGFAYLPSGPFPELSTGSLENPTFHHVGGPWHTFAAGW